MGAGKDQGWPGVGGGKGEQAEHKDFKGQEGTPSDAVMVDTCL